MAIKARNKVWDNTEVDLFGPHVVLRVYKALLGREPDEQAYKIYSDTKMGELRRKILTSEEFRKNGNLLKSFSFREDRGPRILLFGAYGNGNLGDAIQAAVLKEHILSIEARSEVWACSALPFKFPFDYDRIISLDQFVDPEVLENFDLLIIGGGGLFAHPHEPLNNIKWQDLISIPVCIFGVGADLAVARLSEILLNKAVSISARDKSSIQTFDEIGLSAKFVPDPVLGILPILDVNSSGAIQPDCRKLWILRHSTMVGIDALLKLVNQEDIVCFIEPLEDAGLLEIFPQARPVFDMLHLLDVIRQCDVVISMRYHGIILSMISNKPCIAIRENKSLELMERYNNGKFFFKNFSDFEWPNFESYINPRARLETDRALIFNEVRSAVMAVCEGTGHEKLA